MEIFTFLFTDIEGSTALLRRLGAAAYAQVLADHHDVIRSGLAAHDGEEVDTQDDAFFAVFSSPGACVAAAVQMQRAIEGHAWPAIEHVRVRMGIHHGAAAKTATGLVGLDVHRAARRGGRRRAARRRRETLCVLPAGRRDAGPASDRTRPGSVACPAGRRHRQSPACRRECGQ